MKLLKPDRKNVIDLDSYRREHGKTNKWGYNIKYVDPLPWL